MASSNSTTMPSRAELQAFAYSDEKSPSRQTQPTFLTLAPTTSAGYPVTPLLKSPKQAVLPFGSGPSGMIPTLPLSAEGALKTRRSSSLGSDASAKKRFLRLGPVHFGDNDGRGDWSEEVITE